MISPQYVSSVQVGTGLSSVCPPQPAGQNPNGCPLPPEYEYLLTVDYYREEVATVVEELGLDKTCYHLLGHSWGQI